MGPFGLIAILLTVTALLSYLNERFLRLPPTIGVMGAALLLSLTLILLGQAGLGIAGWAEGLMQQVDFGDVLLNGMLSFLLFAGSLHVDMRRLLDRKWAILSLSTFGVLTSTLLLGFSFYHLLHLFDVSISLGQALLFGALISPTDPIAVLGTLKSAGAPAQLEAKIIGESLFNDGVGVVIFTVLLGIVGGGHDVSAGGVALLFVEEAVGGALLGLVLGWIAYRMLRTVDNYSVEILITLAVVAGGYALAGAIHTSGPIAMVIAGLFIGNHGRLHGMSATTREHVDTFWELQDEVLNSVLFVMIGLELLIVEFGHGGPWVALLTIPLALAVRFVSVALPITVIRTFRTMDSYSIRLLTWGGIRGGISIALALSLPESPQRDMILVATYAVVLFSILVQGLTLGRVVRWAAARGD